MKSNADFEKLDRLLSQLRTPANLPKLSFNPDAESTRPVDWFHAALALAAGVACLALCVGLAMRFGFQSHQPLEDPSSVMPPVSSGVSSEESPVSAEPSLPDSSVAEEPSQSLSEEVSTVEEMVVQLRDSYNCILLVFKPECITTKEEMTNPNFFSELDKESIHLIEWTHDNGYDNYSTVSIQFNNDFLTADSREKIRASLMARKDLLKIWYSVWAVAAEDPIIVVESPAPNESSEPASIMEEQPIDFNAILLTLGPESVATEEEIASADFFPELNSQWIREIFQDTKEDGEKTLQVSFYRAILNEENQQTIRSVLLGRKDFSKIEFLFLDDPSVEDEKKFCHATLDQEFAPGRVLVTLTKSASRINKKHSAEEFPGVDIETIQDLTEITTDDLSLVNLPEYRQILCVTLKEKTKENVLRAVKILESLPEVQSATPDYVFRID